MRTLRIVLYLALLCVGAKAQAPAQSAPKENQQPAANASAAGKITPDEAKVLFRSVDDVMEFVSQDTGLPIHGGVKKNLADRDSVVRYVEQKMAEDQDELRFERAELVLKRFGLVPLDFHLKAYMLGLLREQVAGYYDSKTKTMNLLDWIQPEAQKPIMAHELTHALQDQSADLETWHDKVKAAAHKRHNDDDSEVEIDEASSAWGAVLEGQGMAVMLDYMLSPTKRSIFDSPQAVEKVRQSMEADDSTPMLSSAPLILKEALIFPYRDGLGFISDVAHARGRKFAFGGLLNDPPVDTREVLDPTAYLSRKTTVPLALPDLQKVLGKDKVRRYDVGSFGEFDIAVTLRQFGDKAEATKVARGWRAGGYYAVAPAGKKEADLVPGDLRILFVTRWADADAAESFAAKYRAALDKRYPKPKNSEGNWQSADGPARVEVAGDAVISMEGFQGEEAAHVRKAALEALKGSGANVKQADLMLRFATPAAAMLRPALSGALAATVRNTR